MTPIASGELSKAEAIRQAERDHQDYTDAEIVEYLGILNVRVSKLYVHAVLMARRHRREIESRPGFRRMNRGG